jgi:hypothetical protein
MSAAVEVKSGPQASPVDVAKDNEHLQLQIEAFLCFCLAAKRPSENIAATFVQIVPAELEDLFTRRIAQVLSEMVASAPKQVQDLTMSNIIETLKGQEEDLAWERRSQDRDLEDRFAVISNY